MAELTQTKTLHDVKDLFNKVKEVFFLKTANQTLSALTSVDMELPVVSDGVSFDTGAPSVSNVKLTTGETWLSMAEAGDASISFQVASVAGAINDTFLNPQTEEEETTTFSFEGNTYSGKGYDLEPKKVTGGLLCFSEDRQAMIFLPNVEIYANLVIDQSKSGYFNMVVTPLASSNGPAIYIANKTAATA